MKQLRGTQENEIEGLALDGPLVGVPFGVGRTPALRALDSSAFRPFLVALIASGLGLWMQTFALGWLVVQVASQEGQAQKAPFYLGLVGLARAVPALSLGPLGGAFADRFPRTSILIVTQGSAAGLALLLAALTLQGATPLWPILVIAAASSAVMAFDLPTRQSLVPSLVREKDLMSAIGLTGAASNATQILGPVVGGMLLTTVNVSSVFAAICGAFLLCVVVLRVVPDRPIVALSRPSVRRSLGEGIAYIRASPSIRNVLIAEVLVSFFAWPYVLLAPAIVQNDLHAGPATLSMLMAATGIGALLGSFGVASLRGLANGARLLLGLETFVGVALMVFATQSELVAVLGSGVLVGAALISFEGVANGLLQIATPSGLRGRVMSARTLILTGVMPFGQLALGSTAAVRGSTQQVLMAAGLVVLLVSLAVSGKRRGRIRQHSSAASEKS